MIKLFREGSTPRLFTEGAAVDALASGWNRSVKEVGNDQQAEKAETESPKKTKKGAKRATRAEVLELRQRAQTAGISNWDSAPVDRIRRALANAEN